VFQYPIDRSKNFNYTVLSVDFLWEHLKEQLFEYELLSVPSDGGISVAPENYLKVPVKSEHLYPYLLVSVKSGVSIYKVNSVNDYQKIGGSCLGISSIWALLKGDGIKSFEQLVQEAEEGDSSNVDMTVRDIYGTRYLNLPEKITASSCGKLKDFPVSDKKDLTFSLLLMLLFNLGQISAMHCFDLKIESMVVVGSVFLSEFVNRLMRFTLSYYSNGKLRMVFCENSRYLRCLGMFLSQERVRRFKDSL
jgi:type II pantothenate kinase